jgi:hypothetical protein
MREIAPANETEPRRAYRRKPLVVHEPIVVLDFENDMRSFLDRMAIHPECSWTDQERSAEPE